MHLPNIWARRLRKLLCGAQAALQVAVHVQGSHTDHPKRQAHGAAKMTTHQTKSQMVCHATVASTINATTTTKRRTQRRRLVGFGSSMSRRSSTVSGTMSLWQPSLPNALLAAPALAREPRFRRSMEMLTAVLLLML